MNRYHAESHTSYLAQSEEQLVVNPVVQHVAVALAEELEDLQAGVETVCKGEWEEKDLLRSLNLTVTLKE